jgi:dissimilatory sulfite reductase (desulfoviridin) alpha/beta subunit
MQWNKNAEEALSRVPFFVRKRVEKRVEEEAARLKTDAVTLEHVRTCQMRFLNKMEDEVKGFQVETCFGQTDCPNRAVNSDGLSERLEKNLSKRKLKSFLKERVNGPLKMHHEFRISISDCPNACSRPQIVDLGLIGALKPGVTDQPCSECGACLEACKESAISLKDSRPVISEVHCLLCGACIRECPTGSLTEAEQGYRVLLGGKLGRHPRLAKEIPGLHDEGDVHAILGQCLDLYQSHCREGERFALVLERVGFAGFF